MFNMIMHGFMIIIIWPSSECMLQCDDEESCYFQRWNSIVIHPLPPLLACPDQANVTSYLPVRRMAASCTYLKYHRPDFAPVQISQPSQHPDKSSWTSKGRFCSFITKGTKTERMRRGANIPIWRPLFCIWVKCKDLAMWGFKYGRILPFLQMATGAPPTPPLWYLATS